MPAVPSTDVRIRISATAAQANRTFDNLDRRLSRPRMNMEKLNLQFRRLDRIWTLIAVGSGAALIKTFVGMAAELQKTQLQLAAFTRDLSIVPDVMDSMISLTEKVPFTLNTMTTSFVRLKAAGLDPIVDAQGNGPLKDLADAVAAFGGSDEIFKRATIAIQQMAGKGVISMEELRQQLGEAVPTAMRIMAEQMGISVSKLITEVSRGNVEFQKGIDALFAGFREKFGGAGELLKTTFTGQLQQSRLEFEKLSKVILLDSGALDFLTSALKIFNQQINQLGQFLKSPEGVKAIEDFWHGVERIAVFAAQATGPLLNLIDIVASIGNVVAQVAGSLPAEMVGGGILGFVLFGRAGIIPGVIFGIFGDELARIATKIASWVGQIISLADQLGLTETLTGGLIGFLLFGPKGGLIGLVVGVIDKLVQVINKWVAETAAGITAGIANLKAQFEAGFDNPGDIIFNQDKIMAAGEKAGKAARESFMKNFTGAGKFFGDLDTGIIGELKSALAAQGDVGAGDKAANSVKKFIDQVRDGIKPIGEARERIVGMFQAIKDIGGLSPTELTTVGKLGSVMERLREQAEGGGTALGRFRAGLNQDLAKLDRVIDTVRKRIASMAANDTRLAGLKKEFQDLVDMRSEMAALGDTIAKKMGERALGKIGPRIDRIRAALNQFVTEGTAETPLLEQQLDRVESRFSGINKSINDLIRDVKDKTEADADQVKTLKQLEELQKKLNEGLKEQKERTRQIVAATQERIAQQNNLLINQANRAAEIIEFENNFDAVSIAVARAQDRIDRMVESAQKNIAKIRQQLAKGLITQEDADNQIKRWNSVIERVNAAGDKMVERARFNASEWGKLMNSVAKSLEDSLASGIEGFVNRTKTAKEALLDFYNDITRAVSRYLAKQALIGIFGKGAAGGGLGQTIGNFFTPFGSGGLFGFAGGGSMMLGGVGGHDNNILSLNGSPIARVSKGEEMTIDPVGRSSRSDMTNITIHAVDAKSVRELFMREGGALVSSLQSRKRLNRG